MFGNWNPNNNNIMTTSGVFSRLMRAEAEIHHNNINTNNNIINSDNIINTHDIINNRSSKLRRIWWLHHEPEKVEQIKKQSPDMIDAFLDGIDWKSMETYLSAKSVTGLDYYRQRLGSRLGLLRDPDIWLQKSEWCTYNRYIYAPPDKNRQSNNVNKLFQQKIIRIGVMGRLSYVIGMGACVAYCLYPQNVVAAGRECSEENVGGGK